MENKTIHKTDCGRAFKNYDKTCARCLELMNGAKPREGWGDWKRKEEMRQIQAIRNHDCKRSNCNVVCTFGDW